MDYQVQLDTFRGPLDLLLYLVKHNEVDIRDIPIARVTEQFLEYLQVLQHIDVEAAGEFLVMAATLMEIKSRMLLPQNAEATSEENDPRLELVKQLIEYKKFKDAALLLQEQAEQQMQRMPRVPVQGTLPSKPGQAALSKVELWDLVSAFGRLMRETLALQPTAIVLDETPIQVHMECILQRLTESPRLTLRQLFTPPFTRSRLVGLFLALLELIKGQKVRVEQKENFGEIWIDRVSEQNGEAAEN